MRTALLSLFRKSPFENLVKHAELVRDSGRPFQQAVLAYLDDSPEDFENFHNQVNRIEHRGDEIKRNIRGHLPRNILLPVDKFQLLWYLREQDKMLDGIQNALHWLSYRKTMVPDEFVDDLLFMVEKVVDVVSSMYPLVKTADLYFQSYSEKQRELVKYAIRQIRDFESQSDMVERKLKSDFLSYDFENPTSAFHLTKLVQYMGSISDHAENAADMMRAMIAR
jgi:predicted phosphate transport protein (TIGR00153 family)